MVPGQLTDDQGQCSTEETSNILTPASRRNDIPPPGLRRMVPGESSSPETQGAIPIPVDPREQRVVTGVAKDEMDINSMQTSINSPSPTPGIMYLIFDLLDAKKAELKFISASLLKLMK